MFNFDDEYDRKLIMRSQNNDMAAQDEILGKYKSLVKIKARRFFLAGADSDDLIQEGMLGLFKALREYNLSSRASFFTFANTCITNQLLKAIKTANRNKHLPLNLSLSLDTKPIGSETEFIYTDDFKSEYGGNPENLLIDKEEKAKIENEIKKALSSLEKLVLACYLEGNSYLEIARIIEKDEKAVDNALQRIRKKVGKIIG